MNMQAILRQAQNMQKDIIKEKEKIDNMSFEGKSSLVTVTMNGKKQVVKISLKEEIKELEELDILEDMIMIATNDSLNQVDKITEEKLGKYSNMMPGLF